MTLFGDQVPVNSTKGMTGHALGAAGGVEAVLSVLAIEEGVIPPSPGTRDIDPGLRARYEKSARPARLDRVLSNSFGFGGSNCSLVLGRAAA
jgi:3-oxoacyl-[acyl-carrier-protein] synthase-1